MSVKHMPHLYTVRKNIRTGILAVCMLFFSITIFAQQKNPLQDIEKDLVPQRVSFRYNDKSPYASQLITIIEFLKIIFNNHTSTVFVIEKPDVIFDLDASKTSTAIMLTIKGTRIDTQVIVIEQTNSFSNLTISSVNKFLIEYAKEANKLLPPLPPKERVVVQEKVIEKTEIVQVARGVQIKFIGIPGTNLELTHTKKKITLDADGIYIHEQAQNTSLSFKATARGYFPYEKTVFIGKDNITIQIELEKLPTIELEGTLRYANLVPGIHIRYYLVPGLIFADSAFESSAIALIPFNNPVSTWHEVALGMGMLIGDPLSFITGIILLNISIRAETISGTLRLPLLFPFALNCNLAGSIKLSKSIHAVIGASLRLTSLSPIVNIENASEVSIYPFIASLNEHWKIFAEPYIALRIGL